MLLNEVSEFAPKKLREMEETFSLLKKSHNNKAARLKLLQQVKEITKIHDVVIFIDNELNLGVVTKYKNSELLNLLKSFTVMFSKEKRPISNRNLRKMDAFEESSEAIEIIYLFIGKPMLKLLTPQELVAVLLHELGHVYSTTSDIPNNIMLLLKTLLIRPILDIESTKDRILSKLVFLYSMLISLFVRGITFTQHIGEYQADNFALKYGYGDDLVTALNKFKTKEKVGKSKSIKTNSFMKQLLQIFLKIFTPTSDEKSMMPHPEVETRIDKLEKQMFEEYKKTYPNYKEVFDLIRADYKAKEAQSK